MKYGVIGKQVDENLNIVAYRFVDMESQRTTNVNIEDLSEFAKTNYICNAKYVDGDLQLRYQHVLTLPIFYADGKVNTYFYKVILELQENNNYLVGNITGGILSVTLPQYLFKLYDLRDKHDLIVSSKERTVKFSYNMDGTYTTEVISEDKIKNITNYSFSDDFHIRYNLTECLYEGEICYLLNNPMSKVILGCVKGVGRFSVVSTNNTKYSICGVDVVDSDLSKYATASNIIFMDAYLYMNACLLGIDGITFLGKNFSELHNEDFIDYYNGLMTMSPEDAQIFKENLKLGSCNDIVDCNLAVVEIPDGVESIRRNALRYDYTHYKEHYNMQRRSDKPDVVIPSSVKSFDSMAFNVKKNQIFQLDVITKFTNLRVENSEIAVNVINSVIQSNLNWNSLIVNGSLPVSFSLVKRMYEYVLSCNFQSENIEVKTIKTDKLKSLKSVDDLSEFSVLPYINYSSNELYKLIKFQSNADFELAFYDRIKEMEKKYLTIKNSVSSVLTPKLTLDKYKEFEKLVYHVYADYNSLYQMVGHSAIKDGDVLKYRKVMRSLEARFKNLSILKNEKLRLYSLDMQSVWKKVK